MKKQKLSLANVQGKLSRMEMKNIMAGYGGGSGGDARWCASSSDCGPITYRCTTSGGIYQTGQGYCSYNSFPPHCVYGFVCG